MESELQVQQGGEERLADNQCLTKMAFGANGAEAENGGLQRSLINNLVRGTPTLQKTEMSRKKSKHTLPRQASSI